MTRATDSKRPRRIDVHSHVIPAEYVELLGTMGITGTPGRDFPKWSPEGHLKMMDKQGIETSILSMSAPGTYFSDDDFSRRLTRATNDASARIIADHPARFGALASLPLPDVEGSLAELERALDVLGLDGVALLSNVNGTYLGDPRYDELFAELDRRQAVVFVHPNNPVEIDERYPVLVPLLEWPLETVRAVTRLLSSGTLERYPRIRYILAHGGGSVPFLAERIVSAGAPSTWPDRCSADEVDTSKGIELLRGLYYDTAQPGEALFACVRELVEPDHILFGTDAGWATTFEVGLTVKGLTSYDGFSAEEHGAIGRANALALFPRFES